MSAEAWIRAALLAGLAADPQLAPLINSADEEGALIATPPALAIAASTGSDWSAKDMRGREVRVMLMLAHPAPDPDGMADLIDAAERAVEALAPPPGDWRLISTRFLASRTRRLPPVEGGGWAGELQYRFRLLDRKGP